MGVFDFIKDTGSKILKGSREEKMEAAREAANTAKAKAREQADSGGLAAKAREAADKAREVAHDAREKAAEQAAEAKEKAAELEEYLEALGMGGDIDVRFDDGVVYLEGSVPDQETLERVVLAVGNVEGVEKVDDDLDVEAPANAAKMYTVKSGDTLSAIAKNFYGDANRYNEIFEANRPMLSDPNMIYPGQVLRIP
ncbi:peptidoglycan-binding protein LysM [bacterium]|nr:peptidoglycan-binding protein LysM [bacterium]